jgi:hypothetical protein
LGHTLEHALVLEIQDLGRLQESLGLSNGFRIGLQYRRNEGIDLNRQVTGRYRAVRKT